MLEPLCQSDINKLMLPRIHVWSLKQ